jgi:hypothetical protein
LLIEITRERVELVGPELLVVSDPGCRLLHRLGLQRALHDAPCLRALDKAGILEHAQVLQESRQRHIVRRGELAHRPAPAFAQLGEHVPPGPVGERGEDRIELGV